MRVITRGRVKVRGDEFEFHQSLLFEDDELKIVIDAGER